MLVMILIGVAALAFGAYVAWLVVPVIARAVVPEVVRIVTDATRWPP
jgi:hypothetical protein